MFQFLGYNFFADRDCLNNAPSNVVPINSTIVRNAIFDHLNVTKDITEPFSNAIPTWEVLTIMDANFNGNIRAGNVDYALETLSAVKIKRRKKGEFNWLTLTTINIADVEDLNFVYNDYFNRDLETYEYAFVPILNGAEGNYIINEILSKFNGVFICDETTIYKFYAGTAYGNVEQVQRTGIFEPFGRQFPIIVANGNISYKTGTFSGDILDDKFDETRVLDRYEAVKKRDAILSFMTNKRAKIIKDWNGNIWLVMITESPSVAFNSKTGMSIASVTGKWAEIGRPDNQLDMYYAGLLEEVE